MEDICQFIQTATDEEFRVRFPTYSGDRKDFNYDIYKNSRVERNYLAQKYQGGNLPTARSIRKVYKVTMAKIAAEEQQRKERAKQVLSNDPYRIENCMRCLMIKRGMVMLPEHIKCSCEINVPINQTFDEAGKTFEKTPVEEKAYYGVMPLAVALAASKVEHPIAKDQSPIQMIKDRSLHNEKHTVPMGSHTCSVPQIELPNTTTIISMIAGNSTKEGKPLIYAPSGFGKTTFQTLMLNAGLPIVDTDDMPSPSEETVKAHLKLTPVITNQLSLARNIPGLKILFMPSTVDVLKARTQWFGAETLTEQDWKYYFEAHDMIANFETAVIKVEHSYVAQWFNIPRATTIPPDPDFNYHFWHIAHSGLDRVKASLTTMDASTTQTANPVGSSTPLNYRPINVSKPPTPQRDK